MEAFYTKAIYFLDANTLSTGILGLYQNTNLSLVDLYSSWTQQHVKTKLKGAISACNEHKLVNPKTLTTVLDFSHPRARA